MSVLIETSKGDIVIDLYTKEAPNATKNFLKLCKIKHYNRCRVGNIQKDFICTLADPLRPGGDTSIFGILYGDQARFFDDEIKPILRHKRKGTVAMANTTVNQNAARFYITLRDDIDYLDEKHTIFGQVEEGLDVLEKINDAYTNSEGTPYQDIRIHHTIILEDPFPDPERLEIPNASPLLTKEEEDEDLRTLSEDEEVVVDEDPNKEEERQEKMAQKAAQSRAEILEMIGDLPSANVKPPEHVLFICKLNPVTKEDDLEIIFGRFGKIKSCEIIRDRKTNDSLQYGFIEFSSKDECEKAYLKMDNVLIDDRRIHVDFSQSVSKVGKYSRGFSNFMDRGGKSNQREPERRQDKYVGERHNSDRHNNDKYNSDRHNDRGTKRHRSRSREKEREREKEKDKDRQKEREKDKDKDREKEKERDRGRDRERGRDRDRERSRR